MTEPLMAYGLPVVVCEKAPTEGPWAILPMREGEPCVWCGKTAGEHAQISMKVRLLPDE